MAMTFEVRDITTHPQDTGVSQYINFEVKIIQFLPTDSIYAKGGNDTEMYSGESVGVL